VLRRYNSRIKEINESIKNMPYSKESKSKIAALESQKKALQDERDKLLNFNALSDKPKKTKFDPSNEQHRNKAKALFEIMKDKNAVREKLSEEFDF